LAAALSCHRSLIGRRHGDGGGLARLQKTPIAALLSASRSGLLSWRRKRRRTEREREEDEGGDVTETVSCIKVGEANGLESAVS